MFALVAAMRCIFCQCSKYFRSINFVTCMKLESQCSADIASHDSSDLSPATSSLMNASVEEDEETIVSGKELDSSAKAIATLPNDGLPAIDEEVLEIPLGDDDMTSDLVGVATITLGGIVALDEDIRPRAGDVRGYYDDGGPNSVGEMMGGASPEPLITMRRRELRFISTHIGSATRTIAEPGCGDGRVIIALAELGHEVTGVDFSPAMIEAAQSNVRAAQSSNPDLSITLVEADVKDLPFEDEQFDYVVAPSNFIGNIPRRARRAVIEMVRVARKAVILSLFTPEARDVQRAQYERLGMANLRETPDDHAFVADGFYSRRFTIAHIRQLCFGMTYDTHAVSAISRIIVIHKD